MYAYSSDSSLLLSAAFFSKFDTLGNNVFVRELKDTNKTYDFWSPALLTTLDQNFAINGYSFGWNINSSLQTMYGTIYKFNENGDTIFEKRYSFASDAFFRTEDLLQIDNGDFLLAATYDKHNHGDSIDVLLMRTDSLGAIKWTRFYGQPNYIDLAPRIEKEFGGRFLLSYASTNRPKYLLIDSLGNYSWNYSPPLNSGIGAANDILVTRDSAWVFATSKQAQFVGGSYDYDGYVFKFKNGEGIKWGKTLKTEIPTVDVGIRRLVEMPNTNIVAAGLGVQVATNSSVIWITILNTHGDSLWSKDYYPVGAGTDVNYLHEHIVYDMELTSSGYLVLCGETRSTYHPEPQQQGFLLKIGIPTDTTQLQSAQQAIGSDGFYMRLYPNPAQDYTIIDFSTALGEQENYRIFISNAQGQVLRDIPVQSANSGYIVDVAGLAAGVYYVSVLRGGQVLRTEKLVKM